VVVCKTLKTIVCLWGSRAAKSKATLETSLYYAGLFSGKILKIERMVSLDAKEPTPSGSKYCGRSVRRELVMTQGLCADL
jgi:hypothetical protein